VLQCVAVSCSEARCVDVCCSVFNGVAVCYSVLQCLVVGLEASQYTMSHVTYE